MEQDLVVDQSAVLMSLAAPQKWAAFLLTASVQTSTCSAGSSDGNFSWNIYHSGNFHATKAAQRMPNGIPGRIERKMPTERIVNAISGSIRIKKM